MFSVRIVIEDPSGEPIADHVADFDTLDEAQEMAEHLKYSMKLKLGGLK